jgi:hypothetical protein
MRTRPLSRSLLVTALAFVAAPVGARLEAQESRPTVPVSGIVLDSLSGVPLAGAHVQIVALDDARGVALSATTDSSGRFRVDSVPAGRRYAVGFFHLGFDALGLELPPRLVSIDASPVHVELATPSPRTLGVVFCPGLAPADTTGAVVGIVHDADTGMPLPDATVVFVWSELVIGSEGLRTERRQVPVRANEHGRYVACGVPAEIDLAARAERRGGAEASGFVVLRVAPMALSRRDFGIELPPASPAVPAEVAASDTATRSASVSVAERARLTGFVRRANGKPVSDAAVVLLASETETRTDARGAFALVGLPSGTHTVEVRHIGFAPTRTIVDLRRGRESRADVVLDERMPVLDAVTVYGRARPRRSVVGFLERRERGFGHFLTREEIRARHPVMTSDVLRMMPGIRLVPAWPFGYDVQMRDGCRPQVYLDGMRLMMQEEPLDAVVSPQHITAVEVYRSAAEAPAEFPGTNCGSIVIWTGDWLR